MLGDIPRIQNYLDKKVNINGERSEAGNCSIKRSACAREGTTNWVLVLQKRLILQIVDSSVTRPLN